MQCFNNFLEIFTTFSQNYFHFIKTKELLNIYFKRIIFYFAKTEHYIDFMCVLSLAEFTSLNINIYSLYISSTGKKHQFVFQRKVYIFKHFLK